MRYLTIFVAVGLVLALSATAGATGLMWGAASPDWGGSSPVIFMFDTGSGAVSTTYSYSSWTWIMGVADSGDYLYASHNTLSDPYNFQIAKINRATGAVLSDTYVKSWLGVSYSQVNALDWNGGNLYGVENSTSYNSNRGRAVMVSIGSTGDPVGASYGAVVGGAPDGALEYDNGTWYASDWRTGSSSWIKKSTDIMGTNFAATNSTSGVGLVSGWEFDDAGHLLGVSWYYDFHVYDINLDTGVATSLGYDLRSQLPGNITMMGGLSEVVPEPLTMLGVFLGVGGIGAYIRRRRMP